MVMAGVPHPYSLVRASLFSRGQLLLTDHCCHDRLNVQQARVANGSTKEMSAQTADSGAEVNCPELVNAAVPRVSCCLLDASLALRDRRIEDLCAHVVEASTILHDVLATVMSDEDAGEHAGEPSAIETVTNVELVPTPDSREVARVVEIARAMAAA